VFLRFLLAAAARSYSIAIALRNFLYSKGWLKTYRANAVVISIGNITVGGTGKTPLVIWLCNTISQISELKSQNYKCAILTRGYKAIKNYKMKTRKYEDEPVILARSCPLAKVIMNPDRVAGAEEAINKFGANVLVMDDGFQHRRLARDLDIVTIDCTRPFGYGKLLPAGLLREPVASLSRAETIVLTRCDKVSQAELAAVEEKLKSVNPNIVIARSIHAPVCAKSLGQKEIGLEELKNKKIFAFCGIGNPQAFLSTIEKMGLNLVGSEIYNDHHHYTDNDITDIYEQACYLGVDLILTTQKDWTKTALLTPQTVNLPGSDQSTVKRNILFAYLVVELKFVAGEDKLTDLIEQALAGRIYGKPKQ